MRLRNEGAAKFNTGRLKEAKQEYPNIAWDYYWSVALYISEKILVFDVSLYFLFLSQSRKSF